jgi:hypothetical protein
MRRSGLFARGLRHSGFSLWNCNRRFGLDSRRTPPASAHPGSKGPLRHQDRDDQIGDEKADDKQSREKIAQHGSEVLPLS